MSSIDRRQRRSPGTALQRLLRCRRGSVAVEFSALVIPFVALMIGVIQFYMVHLMQTTLSDVLYQSASNPEIALLTGDKGAYAQFVCQKAAFPSMCTASLKLEMQPLVDVPTAQTPITGSTFTPGTSNDVMLLRASVTIDSLLPIIPTMTAKASAIFRRPLP